MNRRQIFQQVSFNGEGLIPVIAQDADNGDVLMMAWMNEESLAATIAEQRAVYWSRSRRKLWRKGEQSGNTQWVREIHLDCDGDAMLLKVEQQGGIACHTGRRSCFFRKLTGERWQIAGETTGSPSESCGNGGE
ncbi:MAG: phosphoribosyl-AMP cyclohydrolase [Halieaceae bacterium]|nr:phosphoribosyl-AMP cyclohydrolase [Halieaceae bacterium]